MVDIGQAAMIAYDNEIYEESIDSPCIVRSSNMCQELGLVSNIFSDKTGTLTRNEMKFVQFFVKNTMYDVPYTDAAGLGVNEASLMKELTSHGGSSHPVYSFLRCLTTCHTVVREKDGTYRAESPDELALVEGVGKFNCSLLERGTTSLRVEMLGVETDVEILAVNAFNADRKRMSIVIRTSNDEYFVMCKGADSIMVSNSCMSMS
jgi:magnesium-transporting ATPase (P-type)